MTLDAASIDRPVEDPVSDVLKWVLLVVAIGTFALLAWATTVTYQTAPPQPDRFVAANGTVLMTGDDIAAGKGGFQKADLMDYGSLYGMGYYGEDCTASALVRLGTATQTADSDRAGHQHGARCREDRKGGGDARLNRAQR